MKIIYLGAEVPSNRTLLETTTANHVGVSFWRLVKRGLPKTKAYLLENYFSADTHIYAHAGIPKTENLSQSELEEFAAQYEEFIANNLDRLSTFNEVYHQNIPLEFVQEQRRTCWSEVEPSKFQPVWLSQYGKGELREMADKYLDIALTGDDLEYDTTLAAVTRGLVAGSGTRFHALNTAKPDNLRQVPVESTSTLSWLSPMLHGETIVWDGTRLVRYNKKMKDQARTRYRNVYEKAGLNYDLIMEDDPQEVCRLAVWSYEQFEARLNMSGDSFLYDNNNFFEGDINAESTPDVSDKKGVEVRKLNARTADEMMALPVFGFDVDTVVEEDGTIKDVPVIKSNAASLRACDTCFVAANCPAFKPQSTCAFNMPLEVKTKDQLKALINAIVEMQGKRVAFMAFSEEMNGGYADPNVSQEIDRLMKILKTVKELDDSSTFIRMTVEGKGASSGVLSTIFGDRADRLKEIPNGGLNEKETTTIIKQALEDN